ncbi:MAG: recombinase XerD, partial [SAR324 cluster bacterium]|nr:recombinase XerD [SAR324 cluster bacterium]
KGYGKKVGVKTRPHGLRHQGITTAVIAAKDAGICLEEVLDYSDHSSVSVLIIYRDRERNVQGKLADLVARETP